MKKILMQPWQILLWTYVILSGYFYVITFCMQEPNTRPEFIVKKAIELSNSMAFYGFNHETTMLSYIFVVCISPLTLAFLVFKYGVLPLLSSPSKI